MQKNIFHLLLFKVAGHSGLPLSIKRQKSSCQYHSVAAAYVTFYSDNKGYDLLIFSLPQVCHWLMKHTATHQTAPESIWCPKEMSHFPTFPGCVIVLMLSVMTRLFSILQTSVRAIQMGQAEYNFSQHSQHAHIYLNFVSLQSIPFDMKYNCRYALFPIKETKVRNI